MAESTRLPERDDEQAGAVAFLVTRSFDPMALTEEIAKAHDAVAHLVYEGKPVDASEDAPVVVWVRVEAEDGVDINAVKRVVKAHEDMDRAAEFELVYGSLMKRIHGDEELDMEDVKQALRLLLPERR